MENNTVLYDSDQELKVDILRQIPTPVMAVNKDMEIIYMNEAGTSFLGVDEVDIKGKLCSKQFKSKHCDTEDCCMKKAMSEKKTKTARNEINVDNKIIPIEYYAVPLFDKNNEVIGGLEYILDISERIAYERRLNEQAYTIQQMSTPTIKLWEGVLMLPIVGVIDSMRAQLMMESMLKKIAETYSRVIILDIHGVAAVDTAVANHLIKITKATQLMGCECILSGISPAVAQTVIQLGIDMQSIKTKATLSDALTEAFDILDIVVN